MNEATRIRPPAVELGASGEEFQNLHEFVRKARANLNQNSWDYIVGAAETETTMRRNRMALDEIAFRPRVLRNVAQVDASVELFGRKLRLPVVLAPVGALELFDPGAAASVARGAGTFGAAHMLSSVTEPGLEKIAEAAPDALRMYQLYVRGGDAFVEDSVSRAIATDYSAFCLTVDTAHYSRRERDIAKRYVRASRVRATGGDFQKGLEWRTVKLIKDKFRIPLVIKGIATAEDAAIALDHGVDWIYVSNHGGRQLDHGRGAMQVLPEIARRRHGPRQDHGRRLVLPRHRYRQGDRAGRRSRRHRPPAMLGAGGGRRSRRGADAGAARGRSDQGARSARRHVVRRTRQILSARGDADQSAPRLQRIPAAGNRTVSVLRAGLGGSCRCLNAHARRAKW